MFFSKKIETSFPLKRFQNTVNIPSHEEVTATTTLVVPYGESSLFTAVILTNQVLDKTIKQYVLHKYNLLTRESLFLTKSIHTNKILTLASYYSDHFDDYGPIIASGSEDGTCCIWNSKTGDLLHRLNADLSVHSRPISSISICSVEPGYPIVVLGSHDKSISIWNLKTGNIIEKLPMIHTNLILSISTYCMAPGINNLRIISGSWDKTIVYWEYGNPIRYRVIREHTKSVITTDIFFMTANGGSDPCPILATGSLDKTAIIWDVLSLTKIRVLTGHKEKITALKIFEIENDGLPPMLITSSDDKTTILWNLLTGDIIRTIDHHERPTCLSITNIPQGLLLVTSIDKGPTTIFNLCATERIRTLETSAVTSIVPYKPRAGESTLPLVMIGTIDSTLSIFEIDNPKGIPKTVLKGHTDRIDCAVIYSPPNQNDPPMVITGSSDSSIRVWNLYSGELIRTIPKAHEKVVLSMTMYSPHLTKLSSNYLKSISTSTIDVTIPLLITGGIDKTIKIWDIFNFQKAEPVFVKPNAHNGFVRNLAMYHPQIDSMEPMFVTASYDKTCALWKLTTMEKIVIMEGHSDNVMNISIYDPALRVNNVQELEQTFSEDKRVPMVVTGSYDQTAAIWDMNSGKLVRQLLGHKDSVTALSLYVPPELENDPLVITGSIDKLVIIWNLYTGERLQTLVGHSDRVCYINVYYHPEYDQPLLFSGGDDNKTIVWEDSLYPQSFMPSRDAVYRYFIADLSNEDWPNISELVQQYQVSIFLENSNLFYLAIYFDRPDFFLKFSIYLSKVITYLKTYPYKSKNVSNPKRIDPSSQIQSPHAKDTPGSLLIENGLFTFPIEINEPIQMNLLVYAIEKNNLIAVRSLLLIWVENLNQDIKDYLTQRMFHPMYYFQHTDLFILASKYPLEYLHFINSLHLIRNYVSMEDPMTSVSSKLTIVGATNASKDYNIKALLNKHPLKIIRETTNIHTNTMDDILLKLDPINRFEVYGIHHRETSFQALWNEVFEFTPIKKTLSVQIIVTRITDLMNSLYLVTPQPVTSLLLPIRHASSIIHLQLYVLVSNQLNNYDIFNSDVVTYALEYFWLTYGRQFHVKMFVNYLIFLFLFCSDLISFDYYYHAIEHSIHHDIGFEVYHGLCILWLLYYFYEEFLQVYQMNHRFTLGLLVQHILFDAWNFIDMLTIVTGLIGLISRIILLKDSSVGKCFLSITSVAVWFKLLYFLRPFASSGPLVAMIVRIAYDIRYFLIVLLVVLLGYSQGFWMLSSSKTNDSGPLPFSTVESSLLNGFLFMLGQNIDTSSNFTNSASESFAIFLLIIFMLTMMILMLNLLIALMGDSFSTIRSLGLALWRREQTAVLTEESLLIRHDQMLKNIPSIIHVLKYTSDIGTEDESVSDLYYNKLKDLVEASIQHVLPFNELEIKEFEDNIKIVEGSDNETNKTDNDSDPNNLSTENNGEINQLHHQISEIMKTQEKTQAMLMKLLVKSNLSED